MTLPNPSESAPQNGQASPTTTTSSNIANEYTEKDGRIPIPIRDEVEPAISAAIHALLENPKSELYQRGHRLVKIVYDIPKSHPGIPRAELSKYRSADAPKIIDVSKPYLREAVDKSAFCHKLYESEKEDKEGKKTIVKSRRKVLPPDWLLEGIIARDRWPFPHLEGIVESPTLRPDGSILENPGFDPQSGYLVDYGPHRFARVNPSMTREHCRESLERLDELFFDFPFKEDWHRSAVLAAVLSVLVRPTIASSVPLFSVSATVQGSGKTLLVHTIECLRSGRMQAEVDPYTHDVEEQRKRILAFAIAGTPLILLDNITGVFGSGVLDAVLTSGQFRDRLLGENTNLSLPMRAVWFATGNNLSFRGDLGRRVIPIDLEAKEERPAETRVAFRHGQGTAFLSKVQREREFLVPLLVGAVHAYSKSQDRKQRQGPFIGSFENWDDLIVGTLLWTGFADPRKGRENLTDFADTEFAALSSLLSWLYENPGVTNQWTSNDILVRAKSEPELQTLIADFCPPHRGGADLPTIREMGYALRSVKGRFADGLKIEARRTKRGAEYVLVGQPSQKPLKG